MFSCKYEVDGYCYLFHCRTNNTQYGCSGSYTSCRNLKMMYDYSSVEVKDIRSMQATAEREADAARRGKKSVQKTSNYAKQIEFDRVADERRRLESEKRQRDIQTRREIATQNGERIPEDMNLYKSYNRLFAELFTGFLWFKIVLADLFGAERGNMGEMKACFLAAFLALPLVATISLGNRFYGKDTLFGKTFRGSAFVRSYLATFIPAIVAFWAVWIGVATLFKVSSNTYSTVLFSSIGIYMVACLPVWWFNHYALPVIWDKGISYYFKQGKKQ